MKDNELYIAVARSIVGKNVRDGSFQTIVNGYNTGNKAGYLYDGEGCSETAAYVAIKSGIRTKAPMANWANGQIQQAKNKGIYSTTFKSFPCLMYVSCAGNGIVDHTTIVIKVDSKYFYTVEGNIGAKKAVVTRTWSRTNKNIIGFATPEFKKKPDTTTIKNWQTACEEDGFSIKADGQFGEYSKRALSATAINYKSSKQTAVCKFLQQFLFDLGYYKGAIDGLPGKYTTAAIKTFQKNEKLHVDGWCGPNMMAHILGV